MSLSSPVASVTFLGITYRVSKQQEERITARILYSATTLPISASNELKAFSVGQVRTFAALFIGRLSAPWRLLTVMAKNRTAE